MRSIAIAVALVSTTISSAVVAAPSLSDPNLRVENYLSANLPTAIRFTGQNEGFLIEKGGAVKRFAGGATSTLFNLPVATDNFERGLLGLAVDPNFASNGFVYIYHTAGTSSGTWLENRLTRYTWNGSALTSGTQLGTFGSASDGITGNGPNHNGGPLVFGRDGRLYGVTGDLNRNELEQNRNATTSAFTGGVYRLDGNGAVPADNPFVGAGVPGVERWYAYGVRNSFGIAVDPHPTLGGNIWITENGPNDYDEINLVTRGMNSGWEQVMGPASRNLQDIPGDLVMLPNADYHDPKFSFRDPIGIAALGFLHGSRLGAGYDDALIFGEANSPNLWLLRLNATRDGFVLTGDLSDGVLDPGDTLVPLGTGFGTITDIQIGPDGAVYLAALGDDTIYRIAAIPEPHTWLLSLAGLALVGWAARRRPRVARLT
jgi:glucose/arabinose dehydrogenase